MSSLLKANPGKSPRFFNQKMEQKEPEKKIPSTAAKATSLSPNGLSLPIHLMAHSAFFFTQGMVAIALNNCSFSPADFMYVSMSREYV